MPEPALPPIVPPAHLVMVGLGARVRLSATVYGVFEITPRVTGYKPGDHQVGFGLEKRAGGHSFLKAEMGRARRCALSEPWSGSEASAGGFKAGGLRRFTMVSLGSSASGLPVEQAVSATSPVAN